MCQVQLAMPKNLGYNSGQAEFLAWSHGDVWIPSWKQNKKESTITVKQVRKIISLCLSQRYVYEVFAYLILVSNTYLKYMVPEYMY